jgi:tRNA dimethylallyltransferase
VSSSPIAIVGPTASGKSTIALELARAIPGAEIVAVDAMCVYRGMDIGTAKPTPAERAEIPHHLIDLADPSEEFTVVRFSSEYDGVIEGLGERQTQPILVGGTGLYVRAVVDRFEPPGEWPSVRAELDTESDTAALHRRLAELDPAAARKMEPNNRRRVVRALEVCLGSGRRFSSFGPGLDAYPPTDVRQVGLRWSRPALGHRIEARFQQMMDDGLLDEVRRLREAPAPMSRTARQALGYKELLDHVEGRTTLDEAVTRAITRTRQFAVRQERWFRRDPRIEWIDIRHDPREALPHLLGALVPCA